MTDANIPTLITLQELADRLRVSPHTVRSWVKLKRLSPTKISRRLLFAPEELQRFLEAAKR